MAEAAGYVIQGKNGRFLSRKKRYVRHTDRSGTLGVQRSWVHNEQTLLTGGAWTDNIAKIYPCRFNVTTRLAEVVGEVMTYEDFLNAHPTTQEC
jgi:hypothetical protein